MLHQRFRAIRRSLLDTLSSFTANGVLYGNGAGQVQATAEGTTGTALAGNTGAAPTFQSIPTVLGYTPLDPANDLSDVADAATAVENLGASLAVPTLAALKALTSRPEAVIVETGQAKGVWQWELGSSTTADDWTVVAPTSGTAGRYKRMSRRALTADLTLYVRTDGSNTNSGESNTAGGAFLTVAWAISVAYDILDLNGHNVTINVGDGTYTAPIYRETPQVGEGRIELFGDEATPSNCVLNVTTDNAVRMYNGATLYISGFKILSSARGLYSAWAGMIYANRIEFGACTSYHIRASAGFVWFTDWSGYGSIAYTISGGAPSHLSAHVGGTIYIADAAVTVSGTPAFSTAFASFESGGSIECTGAVFTGSATGVRFLAVNGGSVSPTGYVFPGSSTGSVGVGGIGPDGRANANIYYSSLFQTAILDDAVTSIQLDSIAAGITLVDITTVGGAKTAVPRGQFGARAGSGGAFTENVSLDLTAVTLTTGALTGTTGTDGKFTISAHSDGKLYFENRTGSTRQISLRILA